MLNMFKESGFESISTSFILDAKCWGRGGRVGEVVRYSVFTQSVRYSFSSLFIFFLVRPVFSFLFASLLVCVYVCYLAIQ